MTRFRVVCADPAWQFKDKLPGAGRGAAKNYKTQAEESIASMLPLELERLSAQLADDAWLFLWRVGSMVELAYRIARRWGFIPEHSEVVWEKLTKNGKLHFGMGRSVRNCHEIAIIAKRGRPERASKGVRSVLRAPVPTDDRGRVIHSAKPEAFYDLVETLCGEGPYLEMNARRHRPGWTCVGFEVARQIQARQIA